MILWPVSFPPGELRREILLDDEFLDARAPRQGLAGGLGVVFVRWHAVECGK